MTVTLQPDTDYIVQKVFSTGVSLRVRPDGEVSNTPYDQEIFIAATVGDPNGQWDGDIGYVRFQVDVAGVWLKNTPAGDYFGWVPLDSGSLGPVIAALQAAVAQLQTDLSALALQVGQNTADIAILQGQVTVLQGQLAALSASVGTLQAQIAAPFVTVGNTGLLTNERAINPTGALGFTDNGPNSTYDFFVNADGITNAMLANMPGLSVKVNPFGVAGDPVDLVAGGDGLVLSTVGGAIVWAAAGASPALGAPFITVGNTALLANERAINPIGALGGTDNGANSTFDLFVQNDGITNAMAANMAPLTVKANPTGVAGDPQDVAATGGTDAVFRESAGTLGWGQVATNGILDAAVTNAKLATMQALSVKANATGVVATPQDVLSIADDTFFGRQSGALGFFAIQTASAGVAGNIYENLVGYVDSSDRNSYPGTGTVVTELMGNGSVGTITGPVTLDDGAFSFNAASGLISITKNAALDNIFDGGGTVIAFYRSNGIGEGGAGDAGRIVDTTDTLDEGWFLGVDTVSNTQQPRQPIIFGANFSGSAGGRWVTTTGTDPVTETALVNASIVGQWNQVAVTYDSSSIANDPTFYVNTIPWNFGETAVPVGAYVSDAGNPVVIGNRSADDRTFDGQIGIVLLFDRVLTQNEIREVFNTFATRFNLGGIAPSTTTGNGQTVYMVAGDTSAGVNAYNAGDVYIKAGSNSGITGGAGRAGNVYIRGGELSGSHSSAISGGNVVIESGDNTSSGGLRSEIIIRVGDNGTTGSIGGDLTMTAAAATAGQTPGAVIMRGGSPTTTLNNRAGGNITIWAGDGSQGGGGGDLFLYSGGVTLAGTVGTTGDIVMSTSANGQVGASTDTGDISINTQGLGATGSSSGNISIICGNVNAASGNDPGDILVQAGAQNQTTQSNAVAGGISLIAGLNAGAGNSIGGGIIITAGAVTNTGATAATGGDVTITAGGNAHNSAASRGGNITEQCGNGTGTNTAGGNYAANAGNSTGTGNAGTVTVRAGNAAGSGLGGDLTLIPGTSSTGTNGMVITAGAMAWSAPISPAAMAVNENDYTPAGIGAANALRLSPAGGGTTITGVGTPRAGRVLLLVNTSAVDTVILAHDDAGSAAANRFFLPGNAPFTIRQNGMILAWYDTASSRWRIEAP